MSENETKLGVAPNMAGLLCYAPCCLGLIFSIVAVVVEKENRFTRFHALQSLLVHAALLVFGVSFWIVGGIASMIFWLLSLAVSVASLLVFFAFLGLLIFMMIKAYGNETYKLPILGDMAEKWL